MRSFHRAGALINLLFDNSLSKTDRGGGVPAETLSAGTAAPRVALRMAGGQYSDVVGLTVFMDTVSGHLSILPDVSGAAVHLHCAYDLFAPVFAVFGAGNGTRPNYGISSSVVISNVTLSGCTSGFTMIGVDTVSISHIVMDNVQEPLQMRKCGDAEIDDLVVEGTTGGEDLFSVIDSGSVSLRGITLRNVTVSQFGLFINFVGNITLDDVVMDNVRATTLFKTTNVCQQLLFSNVRLTNVTASRYLANVDVFKCEGQHSWNAMAKFDQFHVEQCRTGTGMILWSRSTRFGIADANSNAFVHVSNSRFLHNQGNDAAVVSLVGVSSNFRNVTWLGNQRGALGEKSTRPDNPTDLLVLSSSHYLIPMFTNCSFLSEKVGGLTGLGSVRIHAGQAASPVFMRCTFSSFQGDGGIPILLVDGTAHAVISNSLFDGLLRSKEGNAVIGMDSAEISFSIVDFRYGILSTDAVPELDDLAAVIVLSGSTTVSLFMSTVHMESAAEQLAPSFIKASSTALISLMKTDLYATRGAPLLFLVRSITNTPGAIYQDPGNVIIEMCAFSGDFVAPPLSVGATYALIQTSSFRNISLVDADDPIIEIHSDGDVSLSSCTFVDNHAIVIECTNSEVSLSSVLSADARIQPTNGSFARLDDCVLTSQRTATCDDESVTGPTIFCHGTTPSQLSGDLAGGKTILGNCTLDDFDGTSTIIDVAKTFPLCQSPSLPTVMSFTTADDAVGIDLSVESGIDVDFQVADASGLVLASETARNPSFSLALGDEAWEKRRHVHRYRQVAQRNGPIHVPHVPDGRCPGDAGL